MKLRGRTRCLIFFAKVVVDVWTIVFSPHVYTSPGSPLSLRLSLCAKPVRAAGRPPATLPISHSMYAARRRARCMRGEAPRTSACSWCQAAADREKCPISSAGAIRAITWRELRLGGGLGKGLRFGLGGRRASLMEMRAFAKPAPTTRGSNASTRHGRASVRALMSASP